MQNVTLTRNVVVGVVAFIGTPATLDIQALMLFVLNICLLYTSDAADE